MNNRIYLGVDNGASGSIGIITHDEAFIVTTPTKVQQDYTKKKQNITRLDFDKFYDLLDSFPFCFVGLERPMVNATRFKASISGIRIFEAQIVAIERLKIPYIVLDSKAWQKEFFPEKYESGKTKELSNQVGMRIFPKLVNPAKDYDAILIAQFLKLKQY